ncbi:serine/threonine-protein kinase [Alkalinema sp. FACHB-956]|uniref:serine/threonine-protein kinase n=1 Tax=Alkalinema sp. FACHB-956 TaxID=2692768 RepID=UPI001688D747|nr:serine/threonine-protein kinase [Alkalinema sp. FACHB-956]MBD2327483.1 protein kinase [Alkalinema sp. FACHB-956]
MQPPISIGTVLQSRYRLLSILGQGGFGRTYLAEDQARFNEPCALKELVLPQTGEYALEKSKELFQREAQILYQIQHPQIPQFRAMFEENQRFFLVQDYVDGKTYRALLEERKSQGYVFSEPEIIQLMQQVLPVLAYLHGKGIIHRDIAPDNVILRERDRLPVLIDFGVVKELATRIQVPDTLKQSTTVGKLGYAPIEQMQTGRAYPNSDLYALAVTVVVLLTGREPQELLDDSTMTWHWQRWCQVSPAFAQIVNRMLSYTPSQRFQSALEVQQALQNLGQPGTYQADPSHFSPTPPGGPVTLPAQPPTAQPSQMATVAIGRPPEGTEYAGSNLGANAGQRRSTPTSSPTRSSLWDDPWSVGLIGVGVVSLVGIGSWVIARSLGSNSQNQPSPTPTVTISASPSPSASKTPKPSPSPTNVEISQRVDLTPDKPVTRTGPLQANQTLTFNFAGKQGQTLTAALGGEGVLMTILGPDDQPLDRAKRVPFWEGELPFNGSYAVQLKTVQGLSKSDFKLELKLANPIVPSPSPSVSPSPSTDPTPPSEAEVKTERISFSQGQSSAQIQGRTDGRVIRRYLLSIQSGQALSINLQGSGAFIVRRPDGSPLEGGGKSWENPVADTGDYQIDVSANEPAEFTLTVSVR